MLTAFLRAFRTPDLRRKLLFTLGIIALFRLGATIPTPGISEKAARLLARKLPSFCVAPSHCCGCLGGTRGCDIRFNAADASAWVTSQRRSRARR